MFKKKDLRDRDVVTYRNGWKRTFINGNLIDGFGTKAKTINEYDDDLKNKCTSTSIESNLDIVKVERPVEYETVYEKKVILDEAEKRYLRGVIRPFRDKVKGIKKEIKCLNEKDEEEIMIWLKDSQVIRLPGFKPDTMYKNMNIYKEYTLEELGL